MTIDADMIARAHVVPLEDEAAIRARLRRVLSCGFETFEEIPVRHALFRRRLLRVDLLAIPREPTLRDIAIAFETKVMRLGINDGNIIPELARPLKQSADHVLATIEPGGPASLHAGKRVMAVFLFPVPFGLSGHWNQPPKESFLAGMIHFATYSRVGVGVFTDKYNGGGQRFELRMAARLWSERTNKWASNAREILAGKRQIGLQRFSILEELSCRGGA